MSRAEHLRREVNSRGLELATAAGRIHATTLGEVPCVIFGCDETGHGNFHPTSYRNICANQEWSRRLSKVHTAGRKRDLRAEWRWKELDCASSSDALLM